MQKSHKIKDIVFSILWGLTLILIIVLSNSNGELSQRQSGFFSNIYLGIVRFFLNRPLLDTEISASQFLVRKFIGHFLLFLLHGWFSFELFSKIKNHKYLLLFIYGFGISLLSEFLQLLAGGRTFSVIDISLDFVSFLAIPLILITLEKSKNKKII